MNFQKLNINFTKNDGEKLGRWSCRYLENCVDREFCEALLYFPGFSCVTPCLPVNVSYFQFTFKS